MAATLAALTLPSPAVATQTHSGANGSLLSAAGGFGSCLLLIDPSTGAQSSPGACFDYVDPNGGPERNYSISISPDGKRVGGFRYDAANDLNDIRVVDLDGSNPVIFDGGSYEGLFSRFSPDGNWVLVTQDIFYSACCGEYIASYYEAADGTGPQNSAPSDYGITVDWGGAGRFSYTVYPFDVPRNKLYIAPPYPPVTFSAGSGEVDFDSDWSPLADRVLFSFSTPPSTTYHVAVINRDGTGLQDLGPGTAISWSPDGQKILFSRTGALWTMNPDGTGAMDLGVTPYYQSTLWSPDSQKIAYRSSDGQTHVINRDGTGDVVVPGTANKPLFAWQPILKGYARPKGAGTDHYPLVPAYNACTSPNRAHAAPLNFASCNPPTQTSTQLTVGTPDANARPAASVASLRIGVIPGNPATPADEAEANLITSITDVRNASDLTDYTGNLEVRVPLRITDRSNTPYPGGPGPGTAADFTFTWNVPCAATGDPNIGANCSLATTADTLLPGSALEGRRAIWQTDQIEVRDGAGQPFLRQGVFVP
jgi:Tol biopolymer transport system component